MILLFSSFDARKSGIAVGDKRRRVKGLSLFPAKIPVRTKNFLFSEEQGIGYKVLSSFGDHHLSPLKGVEIE
jgi:hypothetical protein